MNTLIQDRSATLELILLELLRESSAWARQLHGSPAPSTLVVADAIDNARATALRSYELLRRTVNV